jgi:hypothetical protein
MMKSKYVFVLTAIAVVLVVGLFVVISGNATASAQSSNQQCFSACCPLSQPDVQCVSGGCCSKSSSDPNKKCDPNSKKKADPNCHK